MAVTPKKFKIVQKEGKKSCHLGTPRAVGFLILVAALCAYVDDTEDDNLFAVGKYLILERQHAPHIESLLGMRTLVMPLVKAGKAARFLGSQIRAALLAVLNDPQFAEPARQNQSLFSCRQNLG